MRVSRDRKPGSNQLRAVMQHELGHALGLAHVLSEDAAFLLEPTYQIEFDGPQWDDIRGLHRAYGDVREKNGGNDAPSVASELGGLTPSRPILSVGTHADGDTQILPDETDFVSIDDNSDVDYFSFDIEGPSLFSGHAHPCGTNVFTGAAGRAHVSRGLVGCE